MFILFLLLTFLGNFTYASSEWIYWKPGQKTNLTLAVQKRAIPDKGSFDYVSLKQLCFALGCKTLYQWPAKRAVVKNKTENLSAILSSETEIAITNGKILSFENPVLTDAREGYFIPVELAAMLATSLKLGTIRQMDRSAEDTPKEESKTKKVVSTIVIDPGHGGNDTGTGHHGLYEKDLTLIFAQQLRTELQKLLPQIEVFLTREDDSYVSLPDRAKLANTKNAQLFISLHVNHAKDSKINGVETYILSPIATDNEARKVALLENDSWLKASQLSANASDDIVKKILVDMEQTKYIQRSALVAALVQQELSELEKNHGLKNRGLKQGLFFVLSQVGMPSVLLEVGFLSNDADRSRFLNVGFQSAFTQRLVSAIKRFHDKDAL